ncbi:MAG: glycosyltransferase [Elusimicrobia bacterium]|nr:glycosyltransferase [Elusimicrobiota bacterium]
MRILLVPDPSSPNGIDAFCRELAGRAGARGHSAEIRPASQGPADADAVFINSLQPAALEAATAAGCPAVLRLIDAYDGAAPQTLAEVRRLAAGARRVLVPSRYMGSVAESWGLDHSRLRVAPFAYDQIFAQQIALVTMRAARPSGFGLVTAAALDENSRTAVETVLAAVSRLRLDCHLAVIGDGPARAGLTERAAALGLGSRASFIGELPHPKKMEYLRAAKAYIEPFGRQGFPALALHAMSEGCPVIGVDEGVVPELVRRGENGLLFKPGDAAGIAEAVVTLASTPGLSLHLIAGGVRTVERHSWDATAAATFDALEELGVRA